MKYFKLFTLVAILFSCSSQTTQETAKPFDNDQLLWRLQVLSHDSLEGRGFGTTGNLKAQNFIAQQMEALNLLPAFADGYRQAFDVTLSKRRRQRLFPVANPGENLVNVPDTILYGGNIAARINGQSDKMIVVTAHLDHLGVRNEKIYNGADDDASGTAALLSIGEYFKKNKPYHTLLLAAVDAEEIGSPGCQFLVDNFPGELDKVVVNVNMDMIGRNDANELWACGTYHYPQLKAPLATIKSELTLHFGHDNPADSLKDDWTRSSDHRIFHDAGIPFIYFGVEDHEDYHRPTDTFEKIQKDFYIKAVELIIAGIESLDAEFKPEN